MQLVFHSHLARNQSVETHRWVCSAQLNFQCTRGTMCKSFVVISNLRGRVTHLTMVIKSPKEWPGRTEPRQPAWGRSGRNNAPDSQWPASRSTIGRDTDTVACMAAGICGALSGISPRDLLLFERKGLVKRTAHPEMPPSSRGNNVPIIPLPGEEGHVVEFSGSA